MTGSTANIPIPTPLANCVGGSTLNFAGSGSTDFDAPCATTPTGMTTTATITFTIPPADLVVGQSITMNNDVAFSSGLQVTVPGQGNYTWTSTGGTILVTAINPTKDINGNYAFDFQNIQMAPTPPPTANGNNDLAMGTFVVNGCGEWIGPK